MSTSPPVPDPLASHRVAWLYAHFKAVSEAGNRYLSLLLFTAALSVATFFSSAAAVKAPGMDVTVLREMILATAGLVGSFLCVAYYGSYDKGEQTLMAIATATGCDYTDLWLVDPAPNALDFARYIRPEAEQRRVYPQRLLAMMMYPLTLTILLTWSTLLSISAVFLGDTSDAWAYVGFAGVGVAIIGWRRAEGFVMRRWETFLHHEKERRAQLATRGG